jgi:glutamine cyclotransferase
VRSLKVKINRFGWDADTLELKKTFEQPLELREGWGMTKRIENGTVRLYVTDGTHKIFIIDPETFKVIDKLEVFLFNTRQKG